MGRSILAIVAGFLTVFVLSIGADAVMRGLGLFQAAASVMAGGMFVLATVYRAVFAILGGVMTGLLTRRQDKRDVWILAGLGVVAGLLGIVTWFANSGPGPLWYAVLIPVIGGPAVLLGGRVARQFG